MTIVDIGMTSGGAAVPNCNAFWARINNTSLQLPSSIRPYTSSRQLTFTGLDTVGPCMIKIRVGSVSAVLEPSTTASATTTFTGFLDGAALGAYGNDHC